VNESSWRRVRRAVVGVLGGLAFLLAAIVALLKYEPGFYRRLSASGGTVAAAPGLDREQQESPQPATQPDVSQAEAAARRVVTKAAACHAAISRPGAWEAAVTADELNAWLAIDLPRNHRNVLPRGVSQPRLLFQPKHALVGARVGYGPLTAVASLDFEIQLRDVNHLAIVLEQARLGAIPLPRPPILRHLAERIGTLGMVTDLRMLDGRLVLMVYIPSTHDSGGTSYWLESLSIGAGELLLAGTTRSSADVRNRLDPPSS
jgi:hypothetical protein